MCIKCYRYILNLHGLFMLSESVGGSAGCSVGNTVDVPAALGVFQSMGAWTTARSYMFGIATYSMDVVLWGPNIISICICISGHHSLLQ
jgi:hypothetical protein